LIDDSTIDWDIIKCSESKETERVNVPVLYRSFKDAEETCNKFVYGSMTGNFKVNHYKEVYVLDYHNINKQPHSTSTYKKRK
jgi:hypothetical protein